MGQIFRALLRCSVRASVKSIGFQCLRVQLFAISFHLALPFFPPFIHLSPIYPSSVLTAQSNSSYSSPYHQFSASLIIITNSTNRSSSLLHLECARTTQCAPLKHHFDECAERVTEQQENPDHKGPKEDCVEECKSQPLSLSHGSFDHSFFQVYRFVTRGHKEPKLQFFLLGRVRLFTKQSPNPLLSPQNPQSTPD